MREPVDTLPLPASPLQTPFRSFGLAILILAAIWIICQLPPAEIGFSLALLSICALVTIWDFRYFEIPDTASAALTIIGLLRGLILPSISDMEPGLDAVLQALLNGLIAFAIMFAIHVIYRKWRGYDGLGFGDVKLAGACATWLDLAGQATALELSALLGLAWAVAMHRNGKPGGSIVIPFGSLLAPSTFIVYIASRYVDLQIVTLGWWP